MSEIQEIPISESGATDTSLSLIKNVPSVKDIQVNLIALRNEHGYSPDGIWSDGRLETAAQGMAIYAEIFNQSSDQLKKYLRNINVVQGFTGVRPVVGLGGQDTLFPQVREELRGLLEVHGKGKIKLELIDYSNVPYKTKKDYELMNVDAIQNVAYENPDLFPAGINPSDWLIQNPVEWPMTPLGEGKDSMIKEVRSGVVSGFPRSASNLYSEEVTSGLNYLKTFKQLIFRSKGETSTGVHNIEHKRLEGEAVELAVNESGLPFCLYSESDLVWAKDAAALARYSTEFLGWPKIIMAEDTTEVQAQVLQKKKADLQKITEAIRGEDESINLAWVQDNIASIQRAVSRGKHDKIFYPACGTDILRTMVAYDATEITAVDTGESLIPRITEQFDKANISLSVSKINETTDELSCEYEGKHRKIKFKKADARLILPSLERGSIDILHIFLPTGAESKISETQGSRVMAQLNLENYKLVSAGGYIVLDERPINPLGETPSVLLKIAGIEEVKITKRHPNTILTSLYPTPEEVSQMDRRGYIYHKTENVGDDLIADVIDGLGQRLTNDYILMEIGRGGFNYLGAEKENTNIVAALTAFTKNQQAQVDEVAKSMLSHGTDAESVQACKQEQKSAYFAGLQKIQVQYKEFLAKYQEVVGKLKAKTIDNAQALEELGIVQGELGRESKKWPIALAYVQNANQGGLQTREAVQQFANFDLSPLQEK